MSYKKHLWCFHGVRVAHVFRFLCCPIISLRSEFRVVMFVTISAYKLRSVRRYFQLFVGGLKSCLCYLCLFGSSLPPVVCKRFMSYIRYLCLFAHTHIMFFFLCLVSPVSLDCPFLIAPSVFSNVYLLMSTVC